MRWGGGAPSADRRGGHGVDTARHTGAPPARPGAVPALVMLLLLALLAGCEGPPTHDPVLPGAVTARPEAPVDLGPPPEPVAVPFRRVKGLPVVEVTLDGHGPFPFILDTGAGIGFTLSRRLARRLRLPDAGSALVQAAGQLTRARWTGVGRLGLGPITFRGVRGVRVDYTDLRRALGGRLEGVIGFPLFRHHRLTIDYPRNQLLLGAPHTLAPDGAHVVPYRLLGGVPAVTIRLAGLRGLFLVDTGSSLGLLITDEMAGQLPLMGPLRDGPRSTTITGRIQHRQSRLDGELRIGGTRITRPEVFVGRGTASIGGWLLRRYRVSFDPGTMSMALEPAN